MAESDDGAGDTVPYRCCGSQAFVSSGEGESGNRIQHAGITNMGIGPAHKLAGLMDEGNLYHGHNLVNYNMIAVTGACLLLNREKFRQIQGFDEELAVAYNDVELCFQLYERGYLQVVCNEAVLLHYESVSRGQDDTLAKKQRLAQELDRLYQKHPDLLLRTHSTARIWYSGRRMWNTPVNIVFPVITW